jgi:hypothetical protein
MPYITDRLVNENRLTYLSAYLQTKPPSFVDAFPWILYQLGVSADNNLNQGSRTSGVVYRFQRFGGSPVGILREELNPPLIKRKCMAEIAHMRHPVDCPWKHGLPTCDPNRRNSIPNVTINLFDFLLYQLK